ncbi:MAG: dUTP diphosphatase [Acidimicrobiia bacterium]|nr:dUTP diphosphatase [Acidimicrobiia bacterium]
MWKDPQFGHFDCISWSPSTPPEKPHDYRLGVQITVQRLDQGLPLPTRAHAGDAGLDLRASESVSLDPGARSLVPTGLAVAIPEGYAGLVVPRSGLAVRHGIGVVNGPGLIDAGYRGELKVILVNHGEEPVSFDRGERIAQLVVVPVLVGEVVEVDELPDTDRGAGGFGSTGT